MVPSPESRAARLVLEPGASPVAGFRLLARLGGGGFGEVWRAEGPGGFPVALKFVRLDRGASIEVRSLEILKHLRHPNLRTPFGSWQLGGYLVIAMELADGSLWDRVQEAKADGLAGIPPEELLEQMDEAARGLDYLNAHRHDLGDGKKVGIQHRDLKPQNILLSGGGVKVADFGLSQLLESGVTGHAGSLTPHYAAPESFDQRTSDQSDQYSLAVTYCLLRGGVLPFRGNPAQLIAGHLYSPPDLSMLPEAERTAVARALSKEADRRWPHCRDFVGELRAAARAPTRPPVPVPVPAPAPDRSGTVERSDPTPSAVPSTLATAHPGSWRPSPPGAPSGPARSFHGLVALGALAMGSVILAGVIVWTLVRPTDRGGGRGGGEVAGHFPPNPGRAAGGRSPSSTSAGSFRLDLPASWTLGCGEGGTLPVKIRRDGYDGPVALRFEGLPEAVRLGSATVPAGQGEVQVEFSVGLAAPRAGVQARLVAVGGPTSAEARIRLEIADSARSHHHQGLKELAALRPGAAIAHFDRAIRLDPRAAAAFSGRADAYQAQGDPDRAIEDYDEAIRLDPGLAIAHAGRGKIYRDQGDYDRAIADSEEAIRLDPNAADPRLTRGYIYNEKGDYSRAIDLLDQAIRLNPRSARAYVERGWARKQIGQTSGAIADCDEAIRLDPENAAALRCRGWIYSDQGEDARAIADYDRAIQLEPGSAINRRKRALVSHKMSDYDRAIADYTEAIRLDPEYASAYRGRGSSHYKKGDIDRAIADYDRAIRLDPGDGIAFNGRGLAHYQRGDYARALADYAVAIELDPKDAVAYNNRGLAHAKLGDYPRAIADYDEAIRLDPGSAAALGNRNDAAAAMGDPARVRTDP